jgi:hypothetical protein
MPNGLLAFVMNQNINSLKSQNVFLLNSILTLLKHVNFDNQHLYPIQLSQIDEQFDYLVNFLILIINYKFLLFLKIIYFIQVLST